MATPGGAGELRHRVLFRRQTNIKKGDTGGLTRSWTNLVTARARVKSINAREAVIGQVLQGISHFEITIRWRSDIKVSDQAIWLTGGNRELNVHSAEDRAGDRKWLTIHASTLAPQGAGS